MGSVEATEETRDLRPGTEAQLIVVGIVSATLAAIANSATPGWTGIGSALWITTCALFWYSPVTGISAVVVSVPLQDQIGVPTFLDGLAFLDDSSFTRFLVAALTVAFLVRIVGGMRIHVDGVAVAYAAVVVMLVVTFGQAERIDRWGAEVYRWLVPLVIYVICRSIPLSLRDRLIIVAALVAGVIASSLVAINQAIGATGPDSFQVSGITRVFGMFGHPNELAAFLGLTLPILIALILRAEATRFGLMGVIVAIATVLGSGALMLTQSRGGWLAFGFGLALVIAFANRAVQRGLVLSGAALLLCLFALGGLDVVPGLSRFDSIVATQGPSVQVTSATWGQLEREAHWGAAYAMLRDHPWLGVGAGQFNEHYREYTPHWRFRIPRGHAHNGYLHMAAQSGFPGLGLYLIWIGTMLIALLQSLFSSVGMQRALAIGALGCLAAYAVHGIVEYLGLLSLPVILAVVIAIALPQADQRRPSPGERPTA